MPWITGNILNLINKKNTVRRKLKSCPTSHLAQKFKELRTSVKNMLRESRENYFTSLGNNFKQNPKRLWSIIKNKSKSRNIPNTVSSAVNSGRTKTRRDSAQITQLILPTCSTDTSRQYIHQLTITRTQLIMSKLNLQ